VRYPLRRSQSHIIVFPLDGAEIALKLKDHELVMPDMPLILKVLIKAEENRSRVHWHAAHDLTLRKQKDVMKSPFKDTRLVKGFGLKEAETLGEDLLQFTWGDITQAPTLIQWSPTRLEGMETNP